MHTTEEVHTADDLDRAYRAMLIARLPHHYSKTASAPHSWSAHQGRNANAHMHWLADPPTERRL